MKPPVRAVERAGVSPVKGGSRACGQGVATKTNIHQDLFFAFGCNALGVPIIAGTLDLLVGLLPCPMIAAAVLNLGSTLLVGNTLGLCRARIGAKK